MSARLWPGFKNWAFKSWKTPLGGTAYREDSRDKDRHLIDAAALAASIINPTQLVTELKGSDHKRLTGLAGALGELDPPTQPGNGYPPNFENPPAAHDDTAPRHDAVMALPAKNSIWRIMPPRARLVVTVLGVIGIVGFIVGLSVSNNWVSAVAIAAFFGAMVISYNYRPQTQKRPPRS